MLSTEQASLCAVRELAAQKKISLGAAERELLSQNIVPARYLRNIGTFGLEGQRRLLASSAAVVGCGGLGGWIVELLARAGVGHLTLVDGDDFGESNLNRQLLCTEDVLGENKARVAARRVQAVNSAVTVAVHPVMLDETNAAALLRGCDVVFDALDTIGARKILLKAAQALKIPVVHGGIAGYWGQLSVVVPGDDTLLTIWENARDGGAESATGNPPFTPSAIASLQVCEGLKLLLGEAPGAKGLVWVDLKNLSMETLG